MFYSCLYTLTNYPENYILFIHSHTHKKHVGVEATEYRCRKQEINVCYRMFIFFK